VIKAHSTVPEGQSLDTLQVTAFPCFCRNLCTPTFVLLDATYWNI